jgi:hypothetical protein
MASGVPRDVYSAIEDHCFKERKVRTVIVPASDRFAPELRRLWNVELPAPVREEALRICRGAGTPSQLVFDQATRWHWLVRPISPRVIDYGVVAVDLGRRPREAANAARRTIEAMLANAAAMFEHIEVARLIQETRGTEPKLARGTLIEFVLKGVERRTHPLSAAADSDRSYRNCN